MGHPRVAGSTPRFDTPYKVKLMKQIDLGPSESATSIEDRATSLVTTLDKLMDDLVGLRDAHGLSQTVLASRMGVSQSAVSQFEHEDSNPTLSTLRRYALAVGARLRIEVVDDAVLTLPVRGTVSTVTPTSRVTWGRTRVTA